MKGFGIGRSWFAHSKFQVQSNFSFVKPSSGTFGHPCNSISHDFESIFLRRVCRCHPYKEKYNYLPFSCARDTMILGRCNARTNKKYKIHKACECNFRTNLSWLWSAGHVGCLAKLPIYTFRVGGVISKIGTRLIQSRALRKKRNNKTCQSKCRGEVPKINFAVVCSEYE